MKPFDPSAFGSASFQGSSDGGFVLITVAAFPSIFTQKGVREGGFSIG
jgi:hypothetical protein